MVSAFDNVVRPQVLYRDRFPVTTTGRLIALPLMIIGIAVVGDVTASIAAWLIASVSPITSTRLTRAPRWSWRFPATAQRKRTAHGAGPWAVLSCLKASPRKWVPENTSSRSVCARRGGRQDHAGCGRNRPRSRVHGRFRSASRVQNRQGARPKLVRLKVGTRALPSHAHSKVNLSPAWPLVTAPAWAGWRDARVCPRRGRR